MSREAMRRKSFIEGATCLGRRRDVYHASGYRIGLDQKDNTPDPPFLRGNESRVVLEKSRIHPTS
jgi:hypothetical protein